MIVRRVAGHSETRAQQRRNAARSNAQGTNNTTDQTRRQNDSGVSQLAIGADGGLGIGIGGGLMLESDGDLNFRIG